MRPPVRLTILLLLLTSAAVQVRGQAPAERLRLVALQDSTMQIASPEAAQALAVNESVHIKRGDANTLLLMRAGFIQLSLGRLSSSREPLDQAQSLFDEAIYRAPKNWPWPWYGLALTDLALDSGGYTVKPSMHQPAGMYYRDAAIRALGMALAADSSFAQAARLLAERLTSTTDPAVNDDVVRAIRRAASSVEAGPQPWLVFARMQRSLDHPDSALVAFRNYLAAGGDTAVAFIEEARSLLAAGDTAAAAPMYLRGAGHAGTGDGRAEYRRDLAWIASPVELQAFDSLPLGSIGQWVAAFWAKRDAEELRGPRERLTEHIRRWVYVHDHFTASQLGTKVALALRMPLTSREPERLPSLTRNFGVFALDAADLPPGVPMSPAELIQQSYLNVTTGSTEFLDDRALIYMRHGEPEKVVLSPGKPGDASPLSWAYDTPADGRLVLSFKCTLYCLLVRFPISTAGLEALDPHFLMPSAKLLRDIEHDLAIGLATDGFPPRFEQELAPEAQFYAVGEPGLVLVVFALPAGKLVGQSLAHGAVGYPITLRLIATDAHGQVARVDTTRRFRSSMPLGKGQYLFGLEELRLAPGTWNVRLLVSQPGLDAGGAIGRIGVTVPAVNAFALSDLVLGREGSSLTWESPAGVVPLNPLDAFPPKGSAELYYELHGATPGTTYQTDIEVKGIYGDAKGTVHLAFNETAKAALVRTWRSIGLDQLEPGQYRITVTVTDPGTRRTAVQSRLLNVAR